MKHKIVYLLIVIGLISCYGSEKNIVKISGKLYSHNSPSSFDGKQIVFFNTTSGVSKTYLGTTKINNNGQFAFEYEISPLLFGPFLRMGFDTSFIASYKLEFLSLGENWNRDFNISDSASLYIKLTDDLLLGDTIYLSTIYESRIIYGPTFNKSAGTIRFLNSRSALYFRTNKIKKEEIVKSGLTGDPIVDTITLDVNP
jgi:hypothetical protein